MSLKLADRSFQYPVGIAKNMLVKVGKFTFPADFVILEMEEDSKKQLNLRVGTKRMIFNIDSAMKHSYSNDDTCFSIDVIDENLEEDFDALLDEGSKILHSIEGTFLEEEIFSEFDKFMAMTTDKNYESESDTEEPPFEKITINTDYKIKISLKEPLMDLELKPLPDILEYVFLEEPSFLLMIISSKLSTQNKSKLIQLLDDKKPVVQKQRRLNPNMQEVVKKEIMKLLDTERIVLGHKVSSAGLEVDKAKIDVILKLPPPTNIKDTPFEFDDECQKAFELLKEKLACAPVIISPNWYLLFELMCDASDFAAGAVLALKRILEKTVQNNPAIWSRKLDDALWAFRTAYKTPTCTTPYKLIYGKNCHLPFVIEHRAYWALKNCNPDLIAAGEKRMFQLHELNELRHQAYENSNLYKVRTKVWHDRKLRMRKEFKHGNKVLLFHSKYNFKQPKLRSHWLGPYVVKHQYPSRYVELYGKDGKTFIVNSHRLKLYHEKEDYKDQREVVTPFFPKE
ncbi:reverse transcriptase domain-containing protein [Tanacetum coccineum]